MNYQISIKILPVKIKAWHRKCTLSSKGDRSVGTLNFSTKGNTLKRLVSKLTTATIAPLYLFTRGDWKQNSDKCKEEILKLVQSGEKLIVRSSSKHEDTDQTSNAGVYLSIPHVQSTNIGQAIKDVFGSYNSVDEDDEVLVQPMLGDVVMSGVAFSHDIQTGAPYRTINWSNSCNTSDVTSGSSDTNLWYHAAASESIKNGEMQPIIALIEELLVLFGGIPIDCEFAITEVGKEKILWLLQARPLILKKKPESTKKQLEKLNRIKSKCIRTMHSHPLLVGEKTLYGIMPDWNPAEILGARPKPLAASLYRELITDSIWADQRYQYGYRDVRGIPLMQDFYGLPYIDVRLSFNSFIPADIEKKLASKLVNYYLDRLEKHPSLHDKVEFDIVYSCYTFDLRDRLKVLLQEGFSIQELECLENSLKNLTNRIIDKEHGLWKKDVHELKKLKFGESLKTCNIERTDTINLLLENTKRYGTLPFAGLARAGFIAIQILQSLIKTGVFTEQDYHKFLANCCTISTKISQDKIRLTRRKFLQKYGHLRPGTYSITSPRYDDKPDLYFDWEEDKECKKESKFVPTDKQMKSIERLVHDHGLGIDSVALLHFIKEAIEFREFSKFLFTRNLSNCLKEIEELGQECGIEIEDMAFCEISTIKNSCRSTREIKNSVIESIEIGKRNYLDTLRLVLPPLITKPDDIFSFEWPASSPNYITQGNVTAGTANYKERDKLAGNIVFMPNADPGFDWIFLQPISGLVTAWGGANSHMAIRAAELEIPAVIGAGEVLYEKWAKASMINLDCARQFVEVVA